MKAKRVLRDYITEVNDTPVFRNALIAEVQAGSPYCIIDADGEVKLTCAKNRIIYKGNLSTTVARIEQHELDWFLSLPHTSIIGKAKGQFITTLDDVEWDVNGNGQSEANKIRYYNIYDRTPTSHTDENGDTIETIPPELHGTLASKPINYI